MATSKQKERLIDRNEATGMRVVAQYVQEFMECGWQPLEHRNDEGIDGFILMKRQGYDLGTKINVQVKCGAGYISSYNDDEIRISVDNAPGMIQHIRYWKRQIEPAIMVFVNPSKARRHPNGAHMRDTRGNLLWDENRMRPKAYWINLKTDNLLADGTSTIIPIKRKNTFGQHSYGDLYDLVKPIIANAQLQPIVANDESNKLYHCDNVKAEARQYYKAWKATSAGRIFCPSIDNDIIISRTGWMHINHKRRGEERRKMSLRLLAVAKQIIIEASTWYLLTQTDTTYHTEQKLGLRAKVSMRNDGYKTIQVIIVRRITKSTNVSKWWFYSVHSRG